MLAHTLVRAAVQLSSAEGYAKNCELIRDSPAPNWEAIVAPVLIIPGTEDIISSVAAAETIQGGPPPTLRLARAPTCLRTIADVKFVLFFVIQACSSTLRACKCGRSRRGTNLRWRHRQR